ncbi:glutamate racemase [Candidatus Gracilibacteria bacterium]|nr:glutamate racemase [Candidatus Gracilibacteria bacterium]
MIGFFDSGFGGLSTLKEFIKLMPEYDYIYFGDSKNAPYGNKEPEEIRNLTEKGVKFLFDKGATVVILACNTAIVHSIKYLQQEVFKNKKILGVTIAGAEKVIESGYKKIGVLATYNTVKYMAYRRRVYILDETVKIQEIEAPLLVPMIEVGNYNSTEFKNILKNYLEKFEKNIEALIIGCTHYSLVVNQIKEILPKNIDLIDPSYESAIKFQDYLERHPEIKKTLPKGGKRVFYTSGNKEKFKEIGSEFLGEKIFIFSSDFSRPD